VTTLGVTIVRNPIGTLYFDEYRTQFCWGYDTSFKCSVEPNINRTSCARAGQGRAGQGKSGQGMGGQSTEGQQSGLAPVPAAMSLSALAAKST
jgi:hypothetical protein